MGVAVFDRARQREDREEMLVRLGLPRAGHELSNAFRDELVRSGISPMRPQRVEDAEVLAAEITSIGRQVESVDDQNTAIIGQASMCRAYPRVVRRLQAEVFVRGKLGITAWVEGFD